MKCQNTRRGFTLIELLVVILIIGILAAVAVPQYQKAVQRSRNAEIKTLIKTVAQAEQIYYLANGQYAANFNELAIDLPLSAPETTVGEKTQICSITVQGTDSIRIGKDFFIVLNSTNAKRTLTIAGYWNAGKYQCAGFTIYLPKEPNLRCREKISYYTAQPGDFCEKVEQGFPLNISDLYYRHYSLP